MSNLIEAISAKRLGLNDVEADIIGRSYEYLIRKFAESSGQSAGEFYTPGEVGEVIARIMDPQPGMEIYDPTCGSAGLLIKCELALTAKRRADEGRADIPVRREDGKAQDCGGLENPPSLSLKLHGQELEPGTWAMANKVALTKAKKDALTALFHTLLHQLMTAQIRVHDLDLEGLDLHDDRGLDCHPCDHGGQECPPSTVGNLEAKIKSFCAVPQLLRFLKDFILFAEKDEELQKFEMTAASHRVLTGSC